MDINELFEGIAGAFRQYQAQASVNPASAGLEPVKKPEKTEKIMATEKGFEYHFPKRE
jgi:hypothetical protein